MGDEETRALGAPVTSSGFGGVKTSSGQLAAPASALSPGTVLGGRYEILELLGEGGMGAVYKARDTAVDRLIALKVIRPDLAGNPAILQRFKQELVLARQVTHRNVIRIFDLGEADGLKFITMEYVEGQDLRSLLRKQGKFAVSEAVAIAEQILSGLQAAHAEGVIHRDLKPGNIMRDPQGRIVVMDFGLARTVGGEGLTQTGMMVGTMEYMSPEQAQAQPVDVRSDLYTVGLIFYELLSGNVPYKAESALASLLKRTQERAAPVSDVESSVPRPLSAIVSKCLERDPAERYQVAQQILDDLAAFQGRGTSGSAVTAPALARKRWMLMGIAAVLVVVIAIAAKLWMTRSRAITTGPHAAVSVLVADFTNHTGDPVFDGTLEPMFNVALEGASFINAYNRGTARKLAGKLPNPTDKLDEQPARLVALSQGVSAVVTGELSRRGDNYSISAMALDAVTGNVLAKAEATAADKQEVLLTVPKLAAPIRKALGDTTPESVQFQKEAGAFTATSLEAVHYDSMGLEQQFAGKSEDALRLFAKATELDPTFTRAYAGMSAVSRNLGRPQDAEKYIKLAMEHVDRLTDRERYRVRGGYYIATSNWQKCVEEYSELIKQYPADNTGNINLAACYQQLRNLPRAAEAARRAVEIAPKGAFQRLNLSFYLSYGGDFQSGEQEARAALELNPSSEPGVLALAEAQLGQGQLSQATESYRKLEKISALGASMANISLADLDLYEGRFGDAARLLEQGAAADLASKNPENAADKFAALARAQLLRRQKAAALAAAEKALDNSKSIKVRFLAAQVFAEDGQVAKAQKLVTSLGSELAAEPQAYSKIIEGDLALKRGDARQAIKAFTEANNLLDTWIGRFELGRGYLEAGAFVEADSEFERCIKRRGEALELFMDNVPTYNYLPGVYYYQGRVREGLKSPGFADYYRTYVSIRGQAGEDPLLPEIHRRLGP